MKHRIWFVGLLIGIGFIISNCTGERVTPGLSPQLSPFSMPEASIQIPDDGRGETALAAYPIAEAEAKRWNSEALLYQIPINRIMEINLGIPAGIPGWFFMFKTPDSPVEFYVKVVEGRVFGMTEAQPILVQELPYKLLPIDVDKLALDSDDVLRLFIESGGAKYAVTHPEWQIDYRLVYLEGLPNPVWSLFDVSNINNPPLFNVDGVTGKFVEDPFQR